MALHAVIMAGGKGERLWPVSRDGRPKQLIAFNGDKSLIRKTVDRLLPLSDAENIYVVTGREIAPLMAQELPDLPLKNILVEPFGRNTAPCIAMAAAFISRSDPEGVMAVFPADHIIDDTSAFQRTITYGKNCLNEFPNHLITIGIEPTYPETGYGYIAPSEIMHSGGNILFRKVESFREKPDRATAERYIEAGCLWNAGMFIWRADTILREIKRHLPTLYISITALMQSDWRESDILAFYESVEPVSIDFGVMERADKVGVIPASLGWNDVGSWDAVGSLLPADAQSNAVQGDCHPHDSHHNVLWAKDKKIVVIGMDDVVVAEGEDAILVCPRNRCQEISKILKMMKTDVRSKT